ncbi:MAG: hypothetical protein JXB60_07075 [Candidatus Cloacimonetes bacterium]|nr:hypothetical protein [Candidatus Cloacimonadota bacterium]
MKFPFVFVAFILFFHLHAVIDLEYTGYNKLILTVEIDDYDIIEGENFSSIRMDWTREDEAGKPDIPYKLINIAVPPRGSISTAVVETDTYRINLSHPLLPIPLIEQTGKTHEYIFNINTEFYRDTPRDFLTLGDKFRFRYYEVVPLRINPFIYDYSTGELTVCRKIEIELTIHGNTAFRNSIPDVYEATAQEFLQNYEQAKFWKTRKTREFISIPFSQSAFWYEILPGTTGTLFLSYNELEHLPSFCDPATVRLFQLAANPEETEYEQRYQLQELPLLIESDSKAGFQKDDRIYFLFGGVEKYDAPSRKLWLTFGGKFPSSPQRRSEIPDKINAAPVEAFKQKLTHYRSTRNDTINCLIIHPLDFLEQSQILAQLHSQDFGLHSHLADQQDIFDKFSGGQPDPLALRDSIESCYLLHPELQYVILMGSGTYDWDNPDAKNNIITIEEGEDDKFVTFNTIYPELSISRLPAKDDDDMDFLLERFRKYIEEPELGWWRNTMVIVPDDENKSGGFEGTSDNDSMNHTLRAENTANMLNPSFFVDKLYTIEYDLDTYQNKPGVTLDLIDKINDGRLIWYYIGHGDPDVLGDEVYFQSSQHLSFLSNSDRLPLFLAASCSVGRFDDPDFDCTSERLLLHREGGSISSIAATRRCGPDSNTKLMIGLLDEVVNNRKNIGTAFFDAKLNSEASIYTSNLYNLLGHPLLEIFPPARSQIADNPPDSLQARELVSFNSSFPPADLNSGTAELRVFDSDYFTFYHNQLGNQVYSVGYRKNGNTYFLGYIEVEEGNYGASFIIPDDIRGYKEIEPLLDFLYDLQNNPIGFIAPGDKTNEINKNYHVRITNPVEEMYSTVSSVTYDGVETTIRLADEIPDISFGIDNFRLFIDAAGRIVSYANQPFANQEYIDYLYPVIYNKNPLPAQNDGPPQVELKLESYSFKDGDYVSTEPLLIALMSDENGINILGAPGHKILVIIDSSDDPIDVTAGFIYDLNSYTSGELIWQLPEVEEGEHILQMVVFDNFNTPTVGQTSFIARKAGKVAIEDVLPYPNPMQDDGYFTFVLTEAANVTLTLYTITGRKIRTLDNIQCDAGYNQIYWDGRDQDGDRLANNNYFFKIRAKQSGNNKITEEIGTFIIFK